MLEIKNLKVVFNENTSNEKVAIDDVSIKLETGDFLTIIGSNGSGKSTILNAILGLVDIKEGDIILNNNSIINMPSYKRSKTIGVVFQNPLLGTAPNMTIEENLALASAKGKWNIFSKAINKKRKEEYKAIIKTLELGLEDRLEERVGLLSGGQRQAMTLLMATKETPDLLLLDEATAALDPTTSEKIMNLTNSIIKEKNITTIMITHNIQNALDYGNKLLLLNQGKVIMVLDEEQKSKMTVVDIMKIFNNNLSDKLILKE